MEKALLVAMLAWMFIEITVFLREGALQNPNFKLDKVCVLPVAELRKFGAKPLNPFTYCI